MSVAILAQYPNSSCLRMPLLSRAPRSQAQLLRCYAKCQVAALTIEDKESMRQAVDADIEIGSWYSGWDPDFLAIEAVRSALGAKCIDFIHSSEICSDRSQFILGSTYSAILLCGCLRIFWRLPQYYRQTHRGLPRSALLQESSRHASRRKWKRVFILRFITCSTMWPSHLSRNVLSVAKGALFGRYSGTL